MGALEHSSDQLDAFHDHSVGPPGPLCLCSCSHTSLLLSTVSLPLPCSAALTDWWIEHSPIRTRFAFIETMYAAVDRPEDYGAFLPIFLEPLHNSFVA